MAMHANIIKNAAKTDFKRKKEKFENLFLFFMTPSSGPDLAVSRAVKGRMPFSTTRPKTRFLKLDSF